MVKPLTTKEFIDRAKKIHGDKYNYSKVEYINSYTKVIIICATHGEFTQQPSTHLLGAGCRKCGYCNKAPRKRMSTETFIKKAKAIHGEKYSYERTKYDGADVKVYITCPVHGDFKQNPFNHLSDHGCPKCGNSLTTKEFIERAKKIHGDKFDYSETIYAHNRTPVIIICPIHGRTEQKPDSHLGNIYGCNECYITSRILPFNEFLERARQIHGDKYSYDESSYVKADSKLKIYCKEHGWFMQTGLNHISGTECPKCTKQRQIIGTEQFIKNARAVHGDKYNYERVKYIHSKNIVEIVCYEHGVFKQRPNGHLRGAGCPKCADISVGLQRRSNTEQFIKTAKEIHGDKYNYDLSEYITNSVPVIIICPEHGEFKQDPNTHLNGCGCPICKESRGEKKIASYLKRHKIKFKQQQTFEDCKNILSLPFDFFLPDYNLLIEYDGIQHFEPKEFFGGEEAFIALKKRDQIKTEYVNGHNSISLLRIAHTDFDNIETILDGIV
jgi:hypothetical protein